MIFYSKLAVECCYSESVGFQFTGSTRALTEFAEILEALQEGVYELTSRCSGTRSPEPCEIFIGQLVLARALGRVRIEKVGLSVRISGNPDLIRILAENIRDFALDELRSEGDGHTHIEYYAEHFFLDRGAEPIIVVCKN